MITEIIVEQQRLDLFEDLGAELNYAIDDIKDFSSRNTNYSKTINVPGNANNNKVFGHIYNFTSGNNYGFSNPNQPNVGYNFDPTKQANCQIFVNKIQVFKGVLRLLEITIQNGVIEYQCAVFGELGGFASAIGNKLLNDSDIIAHFTNSYEEYWNVETIENSWTASGVASGLGIVYPLIDYGLCKNGNKDWHINAFRPAFFVHELIDKIIDFSGYTYTSAFFDTPFFKSLIIPNNKANLEKLASNLLLVSGNDLIDSGASTSAGETLSFLTIINLVLFTKNIDNQTFTFAGTNGTLGKIKLFGTIALSKPGTFSVYVYQNTTELYVEAFTSYNDYQNFDIDWVISTSLDNADYINVYATFSAFEQNVTLEPNLSFEFVADYAQVALAEEGDYISIGNCLPKGIQQKDFFTSICRMFNLYVYEDPQKTTHLLIEPYIEFYRKGAGFLKVNDVGELLLHGEPGDSTGLLLLSDPIAESIDWSNKVDYSREISIKPMSELNARYYDFFYTEDDDYYNEAYNKKYNESYGDRKEDTGYQFAEDRTEVKVIFSPSILTEDINDDKLRANLFKESNGVQERKDNNIRIMIFKSVSTSNYHIKDYYSGEGSSSNGNLTAGHLSTYGYAGHLDDPLEPTIDINFGVPNEFYFTLLNPYPTANLFNSWWDEYLAEIINKDSKLLSCYLYLTVQDIYSLDFSQLIYIDGALWRLNKVLDFNPSIPQTTKCELLRVIELFY
jgi:hypothetical protein